MENLFYNYHNALYSRGWSTIKFVEAAWGSKAKLMIQY